MVNLVLPLLFIAGGVMLFCPKRLVQIHGREG